MNILRITSCLVGLLLTSASSLLEAQEVSFPPLDKLEPHTYILETAEPKKEGKETSAEKGAEDQIIEGEIIKDAGLCACDPCKSKKFDFKNVPPTRIFPRPGNFPIPPSGPGYYSVSDFLFGNFRKAPPKYGYPRFGLMPPGFYNADFRYLDSKDYKERDIFDKLKRIRLGDNWMFTTGGMVWYRYMNEVNSRLSGKTNRYHLERARVWGDLWFEDRFRAFVEFIHADSFGEDLPSLPIDINQADLLNAFVDVKVADIADAPVYVRGGRQEILLGSQRFISTIDWANVRRTFNGDRAFRQGKKFDVDLFWLQPVNIDPKEFDSIDNNRNFAGIWTTYRPRKGTFLDTYYLWLDDTNNRNVRGIQLAPFNVHTIGFRFAGDRCKKWLWDVEAAVQVGEAGDDNIVAGAATAGVGYHAAKLPFTPTFWVYYDYATGDNTPGAGDNVSTFNQLFPFGHYYLGWIDLVGRQNIHDINCHMFFYPTKYITCWVQYHRFFLASDRDALYNAGGVPIRRDATGASGNDVGHEIDFVVNFHLGRHSDVLVGYSKLFGGDFLRNTGTFADAGFFFTQYSFRW